jgi:hypothetical protein
VVRAFSRHLRFFAPGENAMDDAVQESRAEINRSTSSPIASFPAWRAELRLDKVFGRIAD